METSAENSSLVVLASMGACWREEGGSVDWISVEAFITPLEKWGVISSKLKGNLLFLQGFTALSGSAMERFYNLLLSFRGQRKGNSDEWFGDLARPHSSAINKPVKASLDLCWVFCVLPPIPVLDNGIILSWVSQWFSSSLLVRFNIVSTDKKAGAASFTCPKQEHCARSCTDLGVRRSSNSLIAPPKIIMENSSSFTSTL